MEASDVTVRNERGEIMMQMSLPKGWTVSAVRVKKDGGAKDARPADHAITAENAAV